MFSILLRWYFIFNTMCNTTEMFRLLRLPSQGVKTQKLVSLQASFTLSIYVLLYYLATLGITLEAISSNTHNGSTLKKQPLSI